MDFKSLIENKKKNMKATKTILTNALGDKFEIFQGTIKQLDIKGLPFVVDDKPDLQMAMIIPGLYLSSQDPVFSIEILQSQNIKHILSLGIEPMIKFDNIKYHFNDILDIPEFNILPSLNVCLKLIDFNRKRKENILVHCNAGVSRSPIIVIGYLMALENLSYDEAYQRVKLIRNCINPNDGFIRQLKCLKDGELPRFG